MTGGTDWHRGLFSGVISYYRYRSSINCIYVIVGNAVHMHTQIFVGINHLLPTLYSPGYSTAWDLVGREAGVG